ncbi:MAG: nuclear transport factor 2 family protein [Mycobacteriales bacterium]
MTDLAQLQRDVQYLMDRTAILDCIARHARGCDRHDEELLASAYHEDGLDEHGGTKNLGPAYAAFINASHAATSQQHTHNISTHTCDIDGDVAHAESYVLVALLATDGGNATVMSGRYIDRLEKRDGQWRIAARRSTVDLALHGSAALLQLPAFKAQGYPKGTRDRTDASYQRPLDLDTPPSATW